MRRPWWASVSAARPEKRVRKSLKKLLAESPGLAEPEQHERHHAMRIAAKRLRYTLELARPVYSTALPGRLHERGSGEYDLANTADTAKRLQTLLGEVHDCDVWVKTFEEFARKEAAEIQVFFGNSQRFERLRPGLDYLCQERKGRRRQVFAELVAFWQTLKGQGVWERLAAILESGGHGKPSPRIVLQAEDAVTRDRRSG